MTTPDARAAAEAWAHALKHPNHAEAPRTIGDVCHLMLLHYPGEHCGDCTVRVAAFLAGSEWRAPEVAALTAERDHYKETADCHVAFCNPYEEAILQRIKEAVEGERVATLERVLRLASPTPHAQLRPSLGKLVLEINHEIARLKASRTEEAGSHIDGSEPGNFGDEP